MLTLGDRLYQGRSWSRVAPGLAALIAVGLLHSSVAPPLDKATGRSSTGAAAVGLQPPAGAPAIPDTDGLDLDLDSAPARADSGTRLANDVLQRVVDAHREGRGPTIFGGVDIRGELVRIEVLHSLGDAEIEALIGSVGGSVTGHVPGELVEALVPIGSLVELEGSRGVDYLRPPIRANVENGPAPESYQLDTSLATGSATGEQVIKTNVDFWHAAGFTGAGVRIGIIDSFDGNAWTAVQASGDVPAPAGTFCRRFGASCVADFWKGSSHGVAVAEIIYDMAPDAQLYLASVFTPSDVQAAVNYFVANGVDIISRSETSEYDGPGNGTGAIAAVINNAVANGITWFNSAGNAGGISSANTNDAGSYWRSGFVDTDLDGWLEFAPGEERLPYHCALINGIRWSDWGSNRTDYDVYLYDNADSTAAFAWGEANQSTGAPPIELPRDAEGNYPGCGVNDVDWLAIYRFSAGSGTAGDVLEFMTNGAWVNLWSNPYSASGPQSDTASAGGISVGAIDPAMGATVAPYSSQGPTNDNRAKPDLSAAACVDVAVMTTCFNGTSAATPVAAGAAAVVLQSGWASTPAELKDFLRNYLVVERGAPGVDNVYGAGELILTVFVDIPLSIFVNDIEWIAAEGITGGCGPGYYCPSDSVTRGQMAAFLRRALDLPSTTTDFFTDDNTSIFETDINAVAAAGITGGCTSTTYCPIGTVTRGQMAAFLRRAIDLPFTSTDFFTDDSTSIFEADINAVALAGITTGCTPTTFCPRALVTRGQMAAFLRRSFE